MADYPDFLTEPDDQEGEGDLELGRFSLSDDDTVYADVFSENDNFPDADELNFRDLFDAFGVEPDNEFLLDHHVIDGLDGFDPDDEDARGPYTREEVADFMGDTDWWDVADIYYDAETDEYYVDINYEG